MFRSTSTLNSGGEFSSFYVRIIAMEQRKKTVGIMGVSGDPVHDGHIAAALAALELPGMDEVWLMVTPHSPFKDPSRGAALEHRTHLANLAAMSTGRLGHRIKVSDFEVLLRRFGVENSTVTMLEHFAETYPSLQPVWLMGADNLATLHTWGNRWQDIMEKYPVGVFARPGSDEGAKASIAATLYKETFLSPETFACKPGTWTFVESVHSTISSTIIREQLRQGRNPPELCLDAIGYIRQYGLYDYPQTSTQ